MRVERLELTNFRGIRQLTLEFPTQTTVLVGINGVGKSAVLDALAYMFGRAVDAVQRGIYATEVVLGDKGRLHRKDLLNGASTLSIETEIREDGTSDLWRELLTTTPSGTLFPPSVYDSSAGQRDVMVKGHVVSHPYRYGERLFQKAIGKAEASVPLMVQYATDRGQSSETSSSDSVPELVVASQVMAYSEALPARHGTFKAFHAWFRRHEDVENEQRARGDFTFTDPQLAAVRDAIEKLLDGFKGLRIERRQQAMVIEKDGQTLNVTQLSAGEKALLTLVGDMARRLAIANPSLTNPCVGSGVVLIDEVDLHLHPRWQRMVLPALERTFPNCQFIVTTHSPQVLSEVKPECIYLLERKDGETVATRPDASFGLDSNRILEDLMGVDERPRRIKEKLRDFFRLIDEGKLDEAKALRQELEEEIGSDEPNFAKADVLIRRKEMLAGAPHRPQR